MVSRCANPSCPNSFLYLHQGKLFRMDTDITGSRTAASLDVEDKKSGRHVEYFWLCRDCAAEMTLVFKPGVGVTTRPLASKSAAS
jgi:hypothetical protein